MWTWWTTRCCSAIALTALSSSAIIAQSNPPRALFPVRSLWTLALNNQLSVPPVYDDRHGYFALEHDQLAAYDLNTGARQWLVSAHPVAPLAAGEGLLFLLEPQILRALRADDGSTAWTIPFAEKVDVSPVWDNGWLVLATAADEVLAFRAADGALIWRTTLGASAHAPAALAADRVYIPTDDGRIVAIRVETGAVLWDTRLGGPANEILALDERLYVGSNDNYFYCLLTADGAIDWRWRTGADVVGRPLIVNDLVYFVSLDNMLRALHHTRGAQRWRTSLPLRPISGPSQAADVAIVGGDGTSVPAYNLSDGRSAGQLTIGGEPATSPHVHHPAADMLPVVLTVERDIVHGATVTAFTRSMEPGTTPLVPLQNPIMPARPAFPTQD